jgi:amino acid transporter
MFEWVTNNETALWWLAAASVVSFVTTLALVPVLIIRIPSDYYAGTRRHVWELRAHRHPLIRWSLLIGKNLLGWVIILLGIAMLVLPGQGILTIVIGLILINFLGKYRLERWIITRGPVLRTINVIRERSGHAPLEL